MIEIPEAVADASIVSYKPGSLFLKTGKHRDLYIFCNDTLSRLFLFSSKDMGDDRRNDNFKFILSK